MRITKNISELQKNKWLRLENNSKGTLEKIFRCLFCFANFIDVCLYKLLKYFSLSKSILLQMG